MPMEYTPVEKRILIGLGAFGLLVLNSVFAYGVLVKPDSLIEAFTNPISLVFVVESFLLLGIFAYLMHKWSVLRLPWGWFVGLAFAGSMLFTLPVVLLWPRRAGSGESPEHGKQ